jgi:hypothetical protein
MRGLDDSVNDRRRNRVDQHKKHQAHESAHRPSEPANEQVRSSFSLFVPAIFFLALALLPLTILAYLSRKV